MEASTRTRIGAWIATPALNLLEDGEQSIRIEPKAMDVLAYLADRPGMVVSVEEMLREVWRDVVVTDASVYMAIKQLRRALAGSGDDAEYIETIPKRGYRLVARVERLADSVGPESPATSHAAAGPPAATTGRELIARASAPLYRRIALARVPFIALVGAVALAAGGAWLMGARDTEYPAQAIATEPQFTELSFFGLEGLALSPNGRHIAFTSRSSPTESVLNLRSLSEPEAHVVPGTAGAGGIPFWSSDSRHVAYAVVEPGKPAFLLGAPGFRLMRIAVDGGAPQTLAEGLSVPPDGSWSVDDVIAFDGGTGIERISATTGADRAQVTGLTRNEGAHVEPSFLPGGQQFLFTAAFGDPGTYVQSLESGERKILLRESGTAVYANGYLVFNRSGALMAQRFDVEALTLQGEPVQIAEGLLTDATGVYGTFSVSQTGLLAYVIGDLGSRMTAHATSQLAWYDRNGGRLETVGEPGIYRGIDLSNDGRRIAVHRHDGRDRGDILLGDERGTFMRFTDGLGHEDSPVFSPDDTRLIFTGAGYDLYVKPTTGVGEEKLVSDALRFALPSDWTRDGEVLVTHTKMTARDAEISAVHLDGGLDLQELLDTAHNEIGGALSHDSRLLAYSSDETGGPEIYVMPYPELDRKWRVSRTGGAGPQWSDDGELFWFTPDGAIMSVKIDSADPDRSPGIPRELFRADLMIGDHFTSIGDVPHIPFAVTADGQRFLVNERVGDSAGATYVPQATRIVLVRNWMALIDRGLSNAPRETP